MSRELDKKVAEALGYTNIEPWLFNAPSAGWGAINPTGNSVSLAYYSTDIAAAMSALEEFCKTRQLDWNIANEKERGMRCWVGKPVFAEQGKTWWVEVGDTIPLAICNAIIAATSAITEAGK